MDSKRTNLCGTITDHLLKTFDGRLLSDDNTKGAYTGDQSTSMHRWIFTFLVVVYDGRCRVFSLELKTAPVEENVFPTTQTR